MFNHQQNQYNHQSMQYQDPATYMELIQRGVANPDLFVHWTTTNEGMKAIEETKQYLVSTFNSMVSNSGNTGTSSNGEFSKLAEENKMLKSDIEEIKNMLLVSMSEKEVKKDNNGNRKKD